MHSRSGHERMSIFHNDPSDSEPEWRARHVRHGDQRTEVRTHRWTAADRSPGKAHERDPDRQVRPARQATAVRSHGPSPRVSGRQAWIRNIHWGGGVWRLTTPKLRGMFMYQPKIKLGLRRFKAQGPNYKRGLCTKITKYILWKQIIICCKLVLDSEHSNKNVSI